MFAGLVNVRLDDCGGLWKHHGMVVWWASKFNQDALFFPILIQMYCNNVA